MKIHSRFAWQFFVQFTLLTSFLFLNILIVFILLGVYLIPSEINHDLRKADESFYDKHIQRENGEFVIDEELKDIVKQQGGWLMIYNLNGNFQSSYNVPPNLKFDLAMLYKQENKENEFSLWIIEDYIDDPFAVLYGKQNNAAHSLNLLIEQMDWANKFLPSIDTKDMIYYFDKEGRILDTKNSEEPTLHVRALEKLLDEESYLIERHTDPSTSRTILVAEKLTVWDSNAFLSDFKKPFLVFMSILFVIFVLITLYYAKKFGSPLLLLMQWIRQLGNKQYEAPIDTKGKSITHTKKGKLKRKYKLYREMFDTLENVTGVLKYNEEQRLQIERTREEWISGLSHDLKTPLSSVIGYVKMLRSDFKWSDEEIQFFLETMDDKSQFMMELIEDLTLTYRIKNNSIPMQKTNSDLNELIRRTIIQLLNHELSNGYEINFHSEKEHIHLPLDPKWFQRILDNLIMNAIKHNDTGTRIEITTKIADGIIHLTITDNGHGMDQHTLNQLFDRYYRGTNTSEEKEGTGLGMAITKQLIHLHDGSINVESEVGEGTNIHIQMPNEDSKTQIIN